MTRPPTSVLAVGIDARHAAQLTGDDDGITVAPVGDLPAALAAVAQQRHDCVVVDLDAIDASPADLVEAVHRADARLAVVVVGDPADDAATVAALAAGADGHLVRGHLDPVAVRRTIRGAVARKRAEPALVHRALYDPATGLLNRLALDELLPASLNRADRRGTRIGVIFVDLEGVADLDASRGDDVADAAVRAVADRLQDVARDSDLIARVGPSAFVVVCEDLSVDRSVRHLAARLEESLADPVALPDGSPASLPAQLSFASADGTTTPAELLRRSQQPSVEASGWLRR
ncbi:diguanylate cyclase domain-containing protein [Euzebya sp.]|uniref:diguanylate cyclase domain-containing protein n=1 Tax=Euzebya sp. TaxID=1971409 RepID=UPI003511B37C